MKKRKDLCRKKPGKWQTHDKLLNFISDHEMLIKAMVYSVLGFPGGSEVKASARDVGDLGSIPGSGRSPGEENGNLLQYSCLENPMGGGAWWATVHDWATSLTHSKDFSGGTCLLAKLLQSCPTLCDFIDGSPPGSSVDGILQARILE